MDKNTFLKEIEGKFKSKLKKSKKLTEEINDLFEEEEARTFRNLVLFYDFDSRKQDQKFPKIEKLLNEETFQVGRFLIGINNLQNVDNVSVLVQYNGETLKSVYSTLNQGMQDTFVSMLSSINTHVAVFLFSDDIYKAAISSDDAERKILARSEIQDFINSTILKTEVAVTFKLAESLFGSCVNEALTLADCPTVKELEELSKTEDFSTFLQP